MSFWKSGEKLRSNIKGLTQCFITRWNTSKFVKNTLLHIAFSTLFSVFHHMLGILHKSTLYNFISYMYMTPTIVILYSLTFLWTINYMYCQHNLFCKSWCFVIQNGMASTDCACGISLYDLHLIKNCLPAK